MTFDLERRSEPRSKVKLTIYSSILKSVGDIDSIHIDYCRHLGNNIIALIPSCLLQNITCVYGAMVSNPDSDTSGPGSNPSLSDQFFLVFFFRN